MVKNKKSQDEKHGRFVFTIDKDIQLLKCALQHNPWQLGKLKWTDMTEEFEAKFQSNVTDRTLKNRISLLIDKYDKEQLSIKTGTEEQRTERGLLLEDIKAIIEESNAAINIQLNADDNEDVIHEDSNIPAQIDGFEVKQCDIPKSNKKERDEADAERASALEKFSADGVPQPTGCRKKRIKFAPEDELIKLKQEHDMKMEELKVRLEDDKLRNDMLPEEKRIELERSRLDLEFKREERLKEENLRKDEINSCQMKMQIQMLELLSSLARKQE